MGIIGSARWRQRWGSWGKWLLPAFFSLSLLMGLGGCAALRGGNENGAASPTTVPIPIDTPDFPLPERTIPPILPDANPALLTVWLTLENSPAAGAGRGAELAAQIEAFDVNNAGIEIIIAEKALTGQGGILSYLRTGRDVAPQALPDLILLPANQLPAAFDERLIFPLTQIDELDFEPDLFPVAAQMARVNGELAGLPYFLNGMPHLAYDSGVFTSTTPATWSDLEMSGAQMAVPANGRDGADLLLLFYLSLGGSLQDETGATRIQPAILREALALFRQGHEQGWILPESGNLSSYQEAWAMFAQGNAGIVPVSADQFIQERANGHSADFLPLLGQNASVPTWADGWVWAATSTNPTQQRIVGELLSWLTNPENLGTLSANHLTLPARRSAFAYWSPNDPYVDFLQNELEKAQMIPPDAGNAVRSAFQEAFSQVISGSQSAEDAAQRVADLINAN